MEKVDHTGPSKFATILVFVALLILLGLTVAASRTELGRLAFPAAVALATVKAALIILIFMRVGYGKPLVQIFAWAGMFWLALLFGLTLSDYFTRHQ